MPRKKDKEEVVSQDDELVKAINKNPLPEKKEPSKEDLLKQVADLERQLVDKKTAQLEGELTAYGRESAITDANLLANLKEWQVPRKFISAQANLFTNRDKDMSNKDCWDRIRHSGISWEGDSLTQKEIDRARKRY